MSVTPIAHELIPDMPNWHVTPPRSKPGATGISSFINKRPGSIEKINFQTTDFVSGIPCKAPFGVSIPYEIHQSIKAGKEKKFDEDTEYARRSFLLQINDPKLLEFLQKLDEFIIETAIKNKDVWFADAKNPKKITSEETIRNDKYNPILTPPPPDHPEYTPQMRAKIDVHGYNAVQVQSLTRDDHGNWMSEQVTWKDITPHIDVIAICTINSIYFSQGKFGVTILVTKLLIFPEKQVSTEFNLPLPLLTRTVSAAIPQQQQQQQPPQRSLPPLESSQLEVKTNTSRVPQMPQLTSVKMEVENAENEEDGQEEEEEEEEDPDEVEAQRSDRE
jgi:hypothetical protein